MTSQYFVLFAILGWGIGSFFQKTATDKIHPMMICTIMTALYVVLTPLIFVFFKFDKTINTTGVITSLLSGLFMCAGTLGYSFALRGNNAGITTAMSALYPALTLILSMTFLGEQLSTKKAIGMVLALASFILMSLK